MLYHAVSVLLVVAWAPLFGRFLRQWRQRKNPVSLAICATISYLMYRTLVPVLVEMQLGAWHDADMITLVLNAFVVINFYVAFRWSEQRFADARRTASDSSPNVPKDLKE